MIDLSLLNDMQLKAALHTRGPMLVIAGAGSGKTRTLAFRIANLLDNGADPGGILAITFTNKAAGEMRERISGLHGRGREVWVSTFHSACVRILRKDISRLGYPNRFTIIDEEDASRLLRQCVKPEDGEVDVKGVGVVISRQKDNLIGWEDYAAQESADPAAARIYERYQKRLKETGNLDFDDIIMLAVELFQKCPDVLERYQKRLKHVLVDELQDTSHAQWRLVKLLSGKSESLFAVGDDDQSIYGWRGADIRNILSFEKEFPGAEVARLEQNYRSTRYILDAANGVIEQNTQRMGKSLWIKRAGGSRIALWSCLDETAEADAIAASISSSARRNEASYSQCAVLYRANAQARNLEAAFAMRGVPYRLIGGSKLYQRKEAKDLLAYLKAIANRRDDVSYMRILNTPKRGLGVAALRKVSAYAEEMGMLFSDAVADIEDLGSGQKALRAFSDMMDDLERIAASRSVPEILQEVLDRTGYVSKLEAEDKESAPARVENIRLLLEKAVKFHAESVDKSLSAFLEEISLVADIDNYDKGADAVTLMTFHSAKGLEFPNVFIYGAAEGLLPYGGGQDRRKLEEERRLFYVGITRAMDRLTITYPSRCVLPNGKLGGGVSRFVRDIPGEALERTAQRPQGFSLRSSAAREETAFPVSAKITPLEFALGDRVRQAKYGLGVVEGITPKGADYEVTVNFDFNGSKKVLAKISKLKKVEA
jgi:DNA helicase-2/ATP-dependent DNA helicase PcrA